MSDSDTAGAALALLQSLQDPKKLQAKMKQLAEREAKLAKAQDEFAEERANAARIVLEHRKFREQLDKFHDLQRQHLANVEKLATKQAEYNRRFKELADIKVEREGLDHKAAFVKRKTKEMEKREAELAKSEAEVADKLKEIRAFGKRLSGA